MKSGIGRLVGSGMLGGILVVGVASICRAADGAWDASKLVSEKACAACHGVKLGDQAGIWAKGPHANAFKALASDKAKEAAKAAGVEDAQQSGKCLKCHSTAYGFTETKASAELAVEDGVTCQSCHGPAKDYKLKHSKDLAAAKATLGLIVPTAETCQKCHNKENPTQKAEFDFAQAKAKIAHPLKQ